MPRSKALIRDKQNLNVKVGLLIREARGRVSQHELARRTGIRQPQISQIEKGTVGVPLTQLEKIAKALETALGRLIPIDVGATVGIPIVGEISAGPLCMAEAVGRGSVEVPAEMARFPRMFALRVGGNSMIGKGIVDGDMAILRQVENDARPGEIVAATIPGLGTALRTFEHDGRDFWLMPANPAITPTKIPDEGVYIHGVLVSLMRRYQ